ncbi:MAG TPA: hypothetical protein VN026_10200 [Bacteroidia bacterium]|jgi:hypothetical protein|nr:hypothetical protein [Bacteroidia bacterium]
MKTTEKELIQGIIKLIENKEVKVSEKNAILTLFDVRLKQLGKTVIQQKPLYKVYCFTKVKGVTNKTDSFLERASDKEEAKLKAEKSAKHYGFKGKVHFGSVWLRDENKKWIQQI